MQNIFYSWYDKAKVSKYDYIVFKNFFSLCYDFTYKNGFKISYLKAFKDINFKKACNGFNVSFKLIGFNKKDLEYFLKLESFFYKKNLLKKSKKNIIMEKITIDFKLYIRSF
ncbi:hypothetical protein FMM56_01005 [Campylobacter sp. LR264d]|uniref:hypothetical protein n=1 Tax=Campylobacter sp. LR264d TaxID=2593544 RepID=UPI0012392C4E|nr:hypothetical protein [Campylobacter sp. LR264d]KAA6234364.1 hypothetical protein FMM56_01005 [Campylobacter sp. LR264d]